MRHNLPIGRSFYYKYNSIPRQLYIETKATHTSWLQLVISTGLIDLCNDIKPASFLSH